MKLKYANQLTNYNFGELYSAFIKTYGDFKIKHAIIIKDNLTITLKGSYYAVDVDSDGTVYNDSFELNDYGVFSEGFELFDYNAELTKIFRKFMLNKFGKQYMEDCFWNDFGGNSDD